MYVLSPISISASREGSNRLIIIVEQEDYQA